jgi:hypothetical protein
MTIDFESRENIGTLKFPHSEVLGTLLQLKKEKRIRTSTCLGNLEHSKFKFTLKMIDQKMVETSLGINGFKCRFKKRLESQLIEF